VIVVSHTSPIKYLVLVEEIDLLPQLFGRVIIPQAVLDELQKTGTHGPVKNWIYSRTSFSHYVFLI